eukprot:879024_1
MLMAVCLRRFPHGRFRRLQPPMIRTRRTNISNINQTVSLSTKQKGKPRSQLMTMFLVWSDDLLDVFDFSRLFQCLLEAKMFKPMRSFSMKPTFWNRGVIPGVHRNLISEPNSSLIYVLMSGSHGVHQGRLSELHRTCYTSNRISGDVRLVVIDAHGSVLNSNNVESFDENAQCFIYLKDFSDPIFSDEDVTSLRLFEKRFGSRIWERLTIVYTHCEATVSECQQSRTHGNEEILSREFAQSSVPSVFLSPEDSTQSSITQLCNLISRKLHIQNDSMDNTGISDLLNFFPGCTAAFRNLVPADNCFGYFIRRRPLFM